MKEFIEYLEKQIEAGKAKTVELLTDGRKDDANFMKIQTNISVMQNRGSVYRDS